MRCCLFLCKYLPLLSGTPNGPNCIQSRWFLETSSADVSGREQEGWWIYTQTIKVQEWKPPKSDHTVDRREVYIPNCAGCLPSKVLDLSGPQTVFDKYCQVEIKGGKNKIRETQQTQSRDRDRECTWRCLLEIGNGTLESAAKYEAREDSVQSHLASILLFRTTMSYELLRKWRVDIVFTKKVVLKSHLQQTHGKQRLNYTNPECKSWTVTSWSIFQHVWNIRGAQSQFFVNCFTTFVAKICLWTLKVVLAWQDCILNP